MIVTGGRGARSAGSSLCGELELWALSPLDCHPEGFLLQMRHLKGLPLRCLRVLLGFLQLLLPLRCCCDCCVAFGAAVAAMAGSLLRRSLLLSELGSRLRRVVVNWMRFGYRCMEHLDAARTELAAAFGCWVF